MTTSFFNMVTNTTTQKDKLQITSATGVENTVKNTLDNTTESLLEPTKPDSPDTSDMPTDARRALIYLSQQGVVLASNKPQLFNNIVQYQASIRRHLSEIFCSLIIDEHSGVAFVARADFSAENQSQLTGLDAFDDEKEQLEIDGEDVSSLIQKRTLTVYDTLLLLNLRKYYQERQNLGESEIIIDIEKLENLMSPFLPLTDHGSKDRKKLTAKLDDFAKKHKLVTPKRGTQERYEITPMIRYVVNASLLQAMLNEYKALLGETMDEPISTADDTDGYLPTPNTKMKDAKTTHTQTMTDVSQEQQTSLF